LPGPDKYSFSGIRLELHMIVLFTDYGRRGPYTALLQSVIQRQAPGTLVIDLLSDAPAFNIKASAYLLAAFVDQFPSGTIFVAVVDPGVGGERLPVVVEADGYWFVGPHNGLFDVIISRAEQVSIREIDTRDFQLSDSFHGRDIFAPVAAGLAVNNKPVATGELDALPLVCGWADGLYEVIYIDDFGNAFTGLSADRLEHDSRLVVSGREIPYGRTFSDMPESALFWHVNSVGLVEISANQASAENLLNLQVGTAINIEA